MGTYWNQWNPAHVLTDLNFNKTYLELFFCPAKIMIGSVVLYTLPETNIAPENGWLEDEISFWDGLCSGANC